MSRRFVGAPSLVLLLLMSLGAIGCVTKPAFGEREAICERARSALEKARETFEFPGAVAAIDFPDGGDCAFAVGLADLETNAPMPVDARFMAASIGKTITAAVVLKLADEGKLGLDDKVAAWLGDRTGYQRLPNADTMTIRHLLSHTAGLPDHVYDEQFMSDWGDAFGTDAVFAPWSLVAYIFDEEPLSSAGERFAYTDTGYILLGLIIEKASGRAFYDIARTEFLEPLRLGSTEPAISRNIPGLVPGYSAVERTVDTPMRTLTQDGRFAWNPASEWTGGGFVSAPRDLARWIKAYLSGRAAPYVSLDELMEGAPESAKMNGSEYGLGVSRADTAYGPMYGHGGWLPGYRSAAFYFPSSDISYSLQINSDIGLSGKDGHFADINNVIINAIFASPNGRQ